MKLLHYCLVLYILLFSACATSSSYRSLDNDDEENGQNELVIPAGVDSLTAAESSELADSSFVSYEKIQEAEALKRKANAYRAESDTLWSVLSMDTSNTNEAENQQDDPQFVENFNTGAENFTEAREIAQSQEISEEDLERYSELVTNAIQSFEKALQINPFDSQTRLLLAQLYGTKASRLNQEQDHKKAIDVLEKLVRVEKGEHSVYYALGENYYLVGNYELAAQNFEKAIELLHETIPLTDYYYENQTYSSEDSTRAFNYGFYAGDSYIELFRADEAIQAFENAREYAQTDNDIAAIESQIDFINWDDGNILGSMRRDSIAALANNNELEQAESGFLELKDQLKTQEAKDEIEWRLGVVQYQLGKEEQAADRLLALIQRTETNEDGNPIDPDYQRYFNDFGAIMYNIGMNHLNENNNRMALNYFNQSTKI
ncbi:MAG: tetratricopeptide repeat protein [Melioribacteraceae bacterium]|nr:tetratricopeptide repeat protein [Melioribacteraceae bacterium]